MSTSSKRLAANRANAKRSTGPRTAEGKARAAQNARKHPFNPAFFAIPRIDNRDRLASMVADAMATYQPINSQERAAVERIALAQHAMFRMYTLEAGFFANCVEYTMSQPEDPNLFQRSQLAKNIETPRGQVVSYWLAFGFNRYNRDTNIASTFLRFQAQAERLYRRAVEDFHRLLKLRDQLPPETYEEEPNEPTIEPTTPAQLPENTAPPQAGEPVDEYRNEPIAINREPTPREQRQARDRKKQTPELVVDS